MDADIAQSKYETEFKVDYAAVYASLHARLYDKIYKTSSICTLVFGGGTAALLLSQWRPGAILSGLLVSLSGAYMIFVKPADLAKSHRADANRFLKLKARAATKTQEQLERAYREECINCTPGHEGLRKPAYNLVARERGRFDLVTPLTWWERFLERIA